jgi:hypothetical protein
VRSLARCALFRGAIDNACRLQDRLERNLRRHGDCGSLQGLTCHFQRPKVDAIIVQLIHEAESKLAPVRVDALATQILFAVLYILGCDISICGRHEGAN